MTSGAPWHALILLCTAITFTVQEEQNNTSQYLPVIKNGQSLLISEELMHKLHLEAETWHVTPWLRTRTELLDGIITEKTCRVVDPNRFPESIFDEDQLRAGAVIFYAFFGIYAFTLLAIICNDFFIPCVEVICEDLKIPQDVAAATFMAVATSCPEFFVNVISTFLTGSDMGLGTIVGSAIFNTLGVAAIGGLAAITPIAIEMKPVTRDVIVYLTNVSVLVVIIWDGQVDWYEAVVLGILYILYFVVMFNSRRIFALCEKIMSSCCKQVNNENYANEGVNNDYERSPEEGNEKKALGTSPVEGNVKKASENIRVFVNGLGHPNNVGEKEDEPVDIPDSLWRFPKEKSMFSKIWWLYSWALNFILGITIPSPVTCRKFYPLTFIMCMVWIGVNSYFVTWSMSVIGATFLIPDSVMGMTFLAFGGCLPEAVSIFIMSRRGEGGIGVSNALGANSLAILFALGLPWLIKTLTLAGQGAEQAAVLISSNGMDIVVISLLFAVTLLWLILYIGKFKLRKSVGVVLAILYAIFITFAILVELEIVVNINRIARC